MFFSSEFHYFVFDFFSNFYLTKYNLNNIKSGQIKTNKHVHLWIKGELTKVQDNSNDYDVVLQNGFQLQPRTVQFYLLPFLISLVPDKEK